MDYTIFIYDGKILPKKSDLKINKLNKKHLKNGIKVYPMSGTLEIFDVYLKNKNYIISSWSHWNIYKSFEEIKEYLKELLK